jgi:hypothetical protein
MTSASGRREHDARWSSRFTMMVVGGMAAVLVIGVVALTQLGGDGQPASQTTIGAAPLPESPAQAPTRDPGTRTAPVDRRATVVAVLNGTTQTGLARGVADKLEESGFTIGTVGNDADQARSATIVSYTAGNRRAADTVAQIIGVSRRDAVVAIDRNTAVAAGDAKVVVTVGADRIE